MPDLLKLTKPRITVLTLICTAAGYFFSSPNSFEHFFQLSVFVHVLLGTTLIAFGATALNQWYEADVQVERIDGLAFGAWLSLTGFAELWFETNALAALLVLLTLASYVFVYTVVKRRAAVNKVLG
jgi:heme O synthase-like polyprenyltransferase